MNVQAAFVLSVSLHPDTFKLISFSTGSKCLPTNAFPHNGDALHDSHAEVLARRGAIRWFIQEIDRIEHGHSSSWVARHPHRHNTYILAPSVSVLLYISTVPCGDASITLLADTQDPDIRKLKDSHTGSESGTQLRARGRDNYSLHSVLRTKPGRADSPPTSCLSCSDKIARWAVLGFQGALLSRILEPLYIDQVIIDERNIPEGIGHLLQADCDRAFGGRIASLVKRVPVVKFERWPFDPPIACPTSSHEALSWIAGDPPQWDITVRGYKRGVPPRHRSSPRFLPLLCKRSLFQAWTDLTKDIFPEAENGTYFEAKQLASSYNELKASLIGPGCPFEGWLVSGKVYEDFRSNQ